MIARSRLGRGIVFRILSGEQVVASANQRNRGITGLRIAHRFLGPGIEIDSDPHAKNQSGTNDTAPAVINYAHMSIPRFKIQFSGNTHVAQFENLSCAATLPFPGFVGRGMG